MESELGFASAVHIITCASFYNPLLHFNVQKDLHTGLTFTKRVSSCYCLYQFFPITYVNNKPS